MLSPITITKQSPLLGDECVLCKNPLAPGDEVVICPVDSSRHHTHCWRTNGNQCAAYGCRGHGEVESPTGSNQLPAPPLPTSEPEINEEVENQGRIRQTARRLGCGQGCLLVGIAIAIIFFSIGCFGLWAIADYIMLEVLGWQYRLPNAGIFLPHLLLTL